jgi:hypothetical protein
LGNDAAVIFSVTASGCKCGTLLDRIIDDKTLVLQCLKVMIGAMLTQEETYVEYLVIAAKLADYQVRVHGSQCLRTTGLNVQYTALEHLLSLGYLLWRS